ncbi:hypothetical protein BDQ12DRAFT_738158 [Crucibulum laeve]|uniref:Uncharacterized protein n=1 Tax=Crucibulum laeve TaxID=68775 RepID=A0A5C3LN40_9AGAR|nr:hypothetical protein BDQ12DRAFT_738158 [Crucibulum laeve]
MKQQLSSKTQAFIDTAVTLAIAHLAPNRPLSYSNQIHHHPSCPYHSSNATEASYNLMNAAMSRRCNCAPHSQNVGAQPSSQDYTQAYGQHNGGSAPYAQDGLVSTSSLGTPAPASAMHCGVSGVNNQYLPSNDSYSSHNNYSSNNTYSYSSSAYPPSNGFSTSPATPYDSQLYSMNQYSSGTAYYQTSQPPAPSQYSTSGYDAFSSSSSPSSGLDIPRPDTSQAPEYSFSSPNHHF